MLSTKDMTVGGGKARPILGPGNNTVKINNISLDQTPYDKEAFNITLNVETEPVGGDFEGFYKDMQDQSKGRHEGQVGRVRYSQYPYKDTTLASGREISRDQEILKAMIFLGEVLNKREQLDAIEAATIEDFMVQCNNLFTNNGSGSDFVNVCLASREWENKEGYINNDLYLPKLSKDGVPVEAKDVENSRVIKFDRNTHVRPVQKKTDTSVNSFEPTKATASSDFEL